MRYYAVAVLLAGLAYVATDATASSASSPFKNGRIVFSSSPRIGSDNRSIWTVTPTGAHALEVVKAAWLARPAWSPDGRFVAFVNHDGIAVARPDGTVVRKIGEGDDPAWSPDGKRIVTVAGEGDTFIDIIDVASGRRMRIDKLTDSGPGTPTLLQPAWSPDGRRIAFTSDSGGIVFYNFARRRTELPSFNDADVLAAEGREPAHADWSPDGKRIAFDTTGNCYCEFTMRSSIFVARLHARHVRRLARNASQPAWSPDGQKIAFVRLVTGKNAELFVMNADGTNQTRITFRPGFDTEPDWQRLTVTRR